jgi:hypothetical protein
MLLLERLAPEVKNILRSAKSSPGMWSQLAPQDVAAAIATLAATHLRLKAYRHD